MSWRRSLWLAVLSAALFAGMAGHRLDAPGLYYDEAHQVPAAFAWRGGEHTHFCRVPIGGVPWMTMEYSAALKSALFAAVLEATGGEFSVAAWRWLGVALVVVGWVWCATAVGARHGPAAQLAFVALLLTDSTVLLTARHDWGPTALAWLLRCGFVATWLVTDGRSGFAALGLGLLVGLSIFEKLSSAVLLAPLAVALAGAPRRTIGLGLAGLGLGSLPLVVVNVATWSRGRGLISLSQLTDSRSEPWLLFVRGFLSLGQGDWVRRWVLDLPLERPFVWGEVLLMAALLALGCAKRETRRLTASYLAIGAALLLLPRRTQAHHWIIGTPFQYAAIAILVARPGRLRVPATVVLVLLVLLRLPVVGGTMSAIAAARTAPRFDPAQTRVAELLAARHDAVVVASTWGMANQISSFASGRAGAVHEPVYEDHQVDDLARALARTQRSTLYVVEVPREADLFPRRTARAWALIESDPRWSEVEPDASLPRSPEVRVRKFVRGSPEHGR